MGWKHHLTQLICDGICIPGEKWKGNNEGRRKAVVRGRWHLQNSILSYHHSVKNVSPYIPIKVSMLSGGTYILSGGLVIVLTILPEVLSWGRLLWQYSQPSMKELITTVSLLYKEEKRKKRKCMQIRGLSWKLCFVTNMLWMSILINHANTYAITVFNYFNLPWTRLW